MSHSINSSDQNNIQAVDNQLQQYIEQVESGQKLDTRSMAALEEKLVSMVKNPKIPMNIKQNLQMAANELKQMRTNQEDINHLFSAKMQLNSLLNEDTPDSIESTSDEKNKTSQE